MSDRQVQHHVEFSSLQCRLLFLSQLVSNTFKPGNDLVNVVLRRMLILCRLDGWIAKPVDINRLNLILQGVKNPVARRNALYDPSWEGCDGGWFMT